jgi:hypothetical protein
MDTDMVAAEERKIAARKGAISSDQSNPKYLKPKEDNSKVAHESKNA